MTKQELINKIEQRFKKGTKFFKWLGYKNPSQSWYLFRKSNRKDFGLIKVLEFLDELDEIKNFVNRNK